MKSLCRFTITAATVTLGLVGCAQTGADHEAHHPGPMASAGGAAMPMAGMDEHMKRMSEMHAKMMRAESPEQRNALMGEHMKLMQDGMAMMGGMGESNSMPADMAKHQQMMDKRMDMMQMMMEMMMDRKPAPAAAPTKN